MTKELQYLKLYQIAVWTTVYSNAPNWQEHYNTIYFTDSRKEKKIKRCAWTLTDSRSDNNISYNTHANMYTTKTAIRKRRSRGFSGNKKKVGSLKEIEDVVQPTKSGSNANRSFYNMACIPGNLDRRGPMKAFTKVNIHSSENTRLATNSWDKAQTNELQYNVFHEDRTE